MIRARLTSSAVLAFGVLAVAPAGAQETDDPPPASIQALAACRPLTDVAAKAACYDAALDALLGEIDSGETVAVSRTDIEEAQRENVGLGAFRLPGIGLLANSGEEEPEEIILRIVAFGETLDGGLTFDTDSGQHWVQVGSDYVPRMPDPPLDATVRPAFGNSYFVSVEGRRAVRMQRER